jgi:hypothetical protein
LEENFRAGGVMKTLTVLLLAILCSGCGSYKSPTQAPTQAGIVPLIATIMPNNANAGGAGFTMTVNGSNFNSNAMVNWNGAPQPTSHVTANQLTAQIPATAIVTAGTATVSVTNPGSSTPGGPYGGGSNTASETSATVTFTIN